MSEKKHTLDTIFYFERQLLENLGILHNLPSVGFELNSVTNAPLTILTLDSYRKDRSRGIV